MEILFLSLCLIALSYVAYLIFKVLWYVAKLLAFRGKMKRLGGIRATVRPQRPFREIVFGKRGPADYVIHAGLKQYEITLVTFLSTHGRWNIEKGRHGYFVECRRASKFFHGVTWHNGDRADRATLYRNEFRVSRKPLALSQPDPTYEKQILLLYPWPREITYTDHALHEMIEGDAVDGHVLLGLSGLADLLPCEEKGRKRTKKK